MKENGSTSVSPAHAAGKHPPARNFSHSAGETRFFIISDLEDAIAQMPKVHGVRIVAGEGGIEEIHIISANDIVPKSLVRNILTLLLVRFGLRVDRRTVSIVQSDQEQYAQVGRPIIHHVKLSEHEGKQHISVELRSATWLVKGSHVLADGENELQGGSLALIDAIERLIGRRQMLNLNDAKAITLHDRELVVVLVTWHGSRVDESFSGTAMADNGYAAAAARATLDAVNRKLVRLPIVVDS